VTALSVNLNKVALLRNSRALGIPDVIQAARVSLEAGAAGVTVHPRPDQRHIRPDDVRALAQLLGESYAGREFNIEGNPLERGFMDLVRAVRPDQCTLVPDAPDQATSDHGWQPAADAPRLKPIIAELKSLGCRVSVFMDAEPELIRQLADLGADRIELYTEPYAAAASAGAPEAQLERFAAAARAATALGLGVNAGHDLNQKNLAPFLRATPDVLEVSIGHALFSEAIFDGLAPTVRAYLAAINSAR
jgi:pyridoxine 5-phosphate synthase